MKCIILVNKFYCISIEFKRNECVINIDRFLVTKKLNYTSRKRIVSKKLSLNQRFFFYFNLIYCRAKKNFFNLKK